MKVKQNVFLPQVKIMIENEIHWYSIHIPPLRTEEIRKMKLNEPGRQKSGR